MTVVVLRIPLCGKVESYGVFGNSDVFTQQRCDSIRAVVFRVLLPADSENPAIEEPECDSRRPFLAYASAAQVFVDFRSKFWHARPQTKSPIVFFSVPLRAPLLVIDVLLTASCVQSDGLYVTVGVGTDPH